ncbi:MAG: hypothetical protein IPJ88_03135 [Myxococcales bacterium]|nr:MAG: hypothetical protein IPJ88_03135 [Myxococcales bacterium]
MSGLKISLIFAFFLLFSCSKGSLTLIGKSCPCVTGYVCDERTNTCVVALEDTGVRDAAQDSFIPLVDAATPDAYVDPGPQCSDDPVMGTTVMPIDNTNCDEAPWDVQTVFCLSGDNSGGHAACNQWQTITVGNGTSATVIDPKYRGDGSEQYTVSTDQVAYRVVFSHTGTCNLFPSGSDELYFRFYVNLPSDWSLGATLFRLNGFRITLDQTAKLGIKWVNPDATGDELFDHSLTLDAWQCVEIHASSVTDTADLWINDECIAHVPFDAASISQGTDLQYGILEQIQPAASYPQSIVFDEVMVADSRIGCD